MLGHELAAGVLRPPGFCVELETNNKAVLPKLALLHLSAELSIVHDELYGGSLRDSYTGKETHACER